MLTQFVVVLLSLVPLTRAQFIFSPFDSDPFRGLHRSMLPHDPLGNFRGHNSVLQSLGVIDAIMHRMISPTIRQRSNFIAPISFSDPFRLAEGRAARRRQKFLSQFENSWDRFTDRLGDDIFEPLAALNRPKEPPVRRNLQNLVRESHQRPVTPPSSANTEKSQPIDIPTEPYVKSVSDQKDSLVDADHLVEPPASTNQQKVEEKTFRRAQKKEYYRKMAAEKHAKEQERLQNLNSRRSMMEAEFEELIQHVQVPLEDGPNHRVRQQIEELGEELIYL